MAAARHGLAQCRNGKWAVHQIQSIAIPQPINCTYLILALESTTPLTWPDLYLPLTLNLYLLPQSVSAVYLWLPDLAQHMHCYTSKCLNTRICLSLLSPILHAALLLLIHLSASLEPYLPHLAPSHMWTRPCTVQLHVPTWELPFYHYSLYTTHRPITALLAPIPDIFRTSCLTPFIHSFTYSDCSWGLTRRNKRLVTSPLCVTLHTNMPVAHQLTLHSALPQSTSNVLHTHSSSSASSSSSSVNHVSLH